MRKALITLDADDRRAVAGGAAAALGLTTLLALRADWLLARGVFAFRQNGRNVAAYVMGLDLLPWALVFTAIFAAGTVVALGQALRRAPTSRPGSARDGRSRQGAFGAAHPARG